LTGEPVSGSGEAGRDGDAFRAAVHEELARALKDYVRPHATLLGAGTDEIGPARQFLEVLAPGGWVVPRWPREYGGRGGSAAESRVIRDELGAMDMPDLYPFQVGLALVGPALMIHGTPDQCRRWMPAMRAGQQVWCQLFSEPEAGSDLAGLRCRAERLADGWRITGTKIWSSRAHYADLGILLARFDFSLPKHAGIAAFAVDMKSAGVDIRPLRQMNGDTHFSQVFLDGVFVADADRVGEVGQGWDVARTILGLERQSFGSEGSGTGAGIRRRLRELMRRTDATSDPVLLDRFMQVWCDLEVARLTAQRAGALAASRDPAAAAAAAGAKLRMARNLRNVADLALAVQGPAGAAGDGEWHDLFLTAPSLSIRGGTDEVQRNIVAEQVLGLPKEPRGDLSPGNDRGAQK
jgi:acyl-CoA dehydrogenase